MKKMAATTASAVLVAGLAAASTTTSSDAAGSAAPAGTQHVLRLVTISIESADLGNNRPAGVDRLRSVATHEVVGFETFSGIFNPDTDRVRFWLAMALKGGIVDSYFNVSVDSSSFSGRITHGSGAYSGIQGTIDVRTRDNGRAVYIIRYTL
jgi:hypothetical protein